MQIIRDFYHGNVGGKDNAEDKAEAEETYNVDDLKEELRKAKEEIRHLREEIAEKDKEIARLKTGQ
jgi:predicted  nucleic acid-binding Zn-ribbon protein